MTQWSAASIAALGAAGAIIIGAFFGGVVSVITAWRTIAGKVSAIEGHVNSEKTAAEGREAMKDKEILMLREMLAERKITAALLAQSVATVQTPAIPVSTPVLDRIETNTAATAAGVHDLKSP